MTIRSAARRTLGCAAALLLAGCASFSTDGGFDAVMSTTRERGLVQQPAWVRDAADEDRARALREQLLAQPLSADTAVQIALVNNKGLQATYAELGIAEADWVQAGRLRNPGFSFSRLRRGEALEIERTFLFDLLGLITMPLRTELERRSFELVQTRVAAEVLRTAADTRRAWYRTVAAAQSVQYAQQVQEAAEAAAELARRMAAAGNFSKLDHAREQLFYAEASAQLARARHAALAERERLTRLLGLWGAEASYRLPERLPDLPQEPLMLREIEADALRQRLDVRATLQEAENLAASLGLTRATGFVSVLELGYQRNSETGEPHQTGYEIELRLPIFDWGSARNERARQLYLRAVNRAADIAVRARSEVRQAYDAYRTAFDLARHYRDEIVPLRSRISDENVLRYNGMLVSVFELLADARQQIAAVNGAIDALRDFWLADSALQLARTATSPGDAASPAVAANPARESAAGGH